MSPTAILYKSVYWNQYRYYFSLKGNTERNYMSRMYVIFVIYHTRLINDQTTAMYWDIQVVTKRPRNKIEDLKKTC